MTQIYLSRDGQRIDHVIDFVSYHNVNVHDIVLWDLDLNGPRLPTDLEDCICIIDFHMFFTFFKVDIFLQNLVQFLNNHNKIIVSGTHDCAVRFKAGKAPEQMIDIDRRVPPRSLTLLLEADVSDHMYLNHLQSVRPLTYTNWHFRGPVRTASRTVDKTSVNHDFLLTMVKKPGRPHRDLLWKELCLRPGLKDRGLTSFVSQKNSHYNNRLGRTSHQHDWQDGHASMDLYLDCWLEIVPETCYRDLYFFTEKTQKPIQTRTPFLMVSTAGYLEWLRQQGFQTFHTLIDEGYDRHYRIEDRVRHMVDVLEHIVDTGAEEFYRASQPILDHNFSRLCEIAGAWWFRFDQVMWQALEESRA
jgi:hypothetical protein